MAGICVRCDAAGGNYYDDPIVVSACRVGNRYVQGYGCPYRSIPGAGRLSSERLNGGQGKERAERNRQKIFAEMVQGMLLFFLCFIPKAFNFSSFTPASNIVLPETETTFRSFTSPSRISPLDTGQTGLKFPFPSPFRNSP